MAATPRWVTRKLVDEIHSEQIDEHGGSHGIRDDALIDSALARPRNRWEYDPEADVFTLAAAYGFGLAKNHGFIDGNKRVAYMAMYVFLGLNRWTIDVPEPEVVLLMTDVASGERSEDDLSDWLRRNSASRR
jgi:death-on-curing protein